MKGVSGIVATAIMLALTIVGGVLMYTYVARYLNNFTNSAEVVITNAYYVRSLRRLTITVENVGMSSAIVNGVEVILSNNTSINHTTTLTLPPGVEHTITISLTGDELPVYVIVRFGNGNRHTDPYPVRTIG